MSLSTGRVIHRHQWKRLPISQEIIDMVDQLGTKEKQSVISNNFKYRVGQNKMVDDEYEVDESDNQSEQNSTDTGEDTIPQFQEINDDVNEIVIAHEEADTRYQTMQETRDENDDIDNELDNDNDEGDEIPTNNDVAPDVISSNVEMTIMNDDNNDMSENGDDTEMIRDEDNNDATTDDKVHVRSDEENDWIDEVDEESQVSTQDDDKVSHSYNLRERGSINYKSMHRYGETQLIQIQKDCVHNKLTNDTSNNKGRRININAIDLFRRTVGSLFTQLSKVDR